MEDWQSRTRLLLGEVHQQLAHIHVAVAGCGGVGSVAAEMLARCGIGEMSLFDADSVAPSNINRQLMAIHSTLGQPKVDALGRRLHDINPNLNLHQHHIFLNSDNIPTQFSAPCPDYVVDAIDTLEAKAALIRYCLQKGISMVVSLGAGGKTQPGQVGLGILGKAHGDPLGKALKKILRDSCPEACGKLPVVFSTQPSNPAARQTAQDEQGKRWILGTLPTVTAAFGIHLAQHVIDLATANNVAVEPQA